MYYKGLIENLARISSDPKRFAAIHARAKSGNRVSAFILSYVYLYRNDLKNALKMADFAATDHTAYRVQHAICVHLVANCILPIQFSAESPSPKDEAPSESPSDQKN